MKAKCFKMSIFFGLIILGTTILMGCSSADFDSSASAGVARVSEAATPSSSAADSANSEADFVFDAVSEQAMSVESAGITILSPTTTGRQLVYTINMSLQTTEFMPSVRLLLDTVSSFAGYSEWVLLNGRCLSRPDIQRTANFNLRIPTENLERFIYFVENNYNILRLEKILNDQTSVYNHDNFELEILREREQELLGNDGSQPDLIAVRRQIRDLERSTDDLQNRVIYSTVSVSLAEFIEAEIPEPIRFGERVGTVLVESLQMVVIIFVAIFPWVAPAGIIIGLIVFLVKRSEKKRKNELNQLLTKSSE